MVDLLDPRAQEFSLTGDRNDTVLMVHGFLDNPCSMRYLSRNVHEETGWNVEVMRLPGHGTRPEDLRETTGWQWLRAVRERYDELSRQSDRIVLLGVSLGGLLSYRVASSVNPDGLILLVPALAYAHRWYYFLPIDDWANTVGRLVPYVPRLGLGGLSDRTLEDQLLLYDWVPTASVREITELMNQTREQLEPERLQFPILGLLAENDPVVSTPYARRQLTSAPNPSNKIRILKPTSHIIHLDHRRQQVAEATSRFLETLS